MIRIPTHSDVGYVQAEKHGAAFVLVRGSAAEHIARVQKIERPAQIAKKIALSPYTVGIAGLAILVVSLLIVLLLWQWEIASVNLEQVLPYLVIGYLGLFALGGLMSLASVLINNATGRRVEAFLEETRPVKVMPLGWPQDMAVPVEYWDRPRFYVEAFRYLTPGMRDRVFDLPGDHVESLRGALDKFIKDEAETLTRDAEKEAKKAKARARSQSRHILGY